MGLEPKNGIRLSEALQREVEDLARRTGEPPLTVVMKGLELLKSALDSRESSRGGNGEAPFAASVYAQWEAVGLIGSAKGLPADLSTNPQHMEGLGSG